MSKWLIASDNEDSEAYKKQQEEFQKQLQDIDKGIRTINKDEYKNDLHKLLVDLQLHKIDRDVNKDIFLKSVKELIENGYSFYLLKNYLISKDKSEEEKELFYQALKNSFEEGKSLELVNYYIGSDIFKNILDKAITDGYSAQLLELDTIKRNDDIVAYIKSKSDDLFEEVE